MATRKSTSYNATRFYLAHILRHNSDDITGVVVDPKPAERLQRAHGTAGNEVACVSWQGRLYRLHTADQMEELIAPAGRYLSLPRTIENGKRFPFIIVADFDEENAKAQVLR